jgi:uncharacterized membrane protein
MTQLNDSPSSSTVTTRPLRPRPDDAGSIARGMLGITTVLMGLIAGFFYAYACSVMLGLAEVDDRTFIDTMQAINATVRNAGFAPSFFGSLVASVATAMVLYAKRSPARHLVALAAALYFAAFAITFGISVPMNNELADAGSIATITDHAAVREAYEDPWVVWNVIRTAFATAALAALVAAGMRVNRSR